MREIGRREGHALHRAALLLKIEAREIHVRGARDFHIALGAEHHEHIVAKALDERGFVRSGYAILLRFAKGVAQQRVGKSLRRLREHDAFARNRGRNQSDILRQARAFHFFHRVDRGNAQDRGAARRALRRSRDRSARASRTGAPRRAPEQFRWPDPPAPARSPRIAGAYRRREPRARAAPRPAFATLSCSEDDVIGARGDEKIGDGGAGGQPAQRENNQRHAVEFEELLRQIGAHAGAESGGGNDGGDSAH